MPPLVDAAWLAEHIGDADLVVADVRWSLAGGAAIQAYRAGHIPGAVFVDVDAHLSDHSRGGPGRHPLPAPTRFARTMGSLGVADRDLVVAYDDTGGSTAARLWWMLRATGHRAAVLDGGLAAWRGTLDTGVTAHPPAVFTVPGDDWPGVVDASGVSARIGTTPVIDVRAGERFRGEVEPVDPRAGHIPGARSLPFATLLDESGRLRGAGDLAHRFAEAGVTAADEPVLHCGSGVTACHGLLALEVAGLGPGLLYEGSWSDWCADPDRPVATGA